MKCYIPVEAVCSMLFNMLHQTWWCSWRRPGACCSPASGITVAGPGHDGDCAQAPIRLVAYRTAGVVARCRLVVRKKRCRAAIPVGLLTAHAHPASDGLHGQIKFWVGLTEDAHTDEAKLITDMTRAVTRTWLTRARRIQTELPRCPTPVEIWFPANSERLSPKLGRRGLYTNRLQNKYTILYACQYCSCYMQYNIIGCAATAAEF